MKRLFCVITGKGHKLRLQDIPSSLGYTFTHPQKPNDVFYLADKREAKNLRDLYPADCHVSRGPDHIGKHSGYHMPSMRRQPKRVIL